MSNHASTARQACAPDTDALTRELAELIVQALNLELSAAAIDADAPLYGEGLGLDSIDILEIALVVSKRYAVQLRADNAENEQIFRSLRRLAEYIIAHRTT
ncbi:MAG: phosphopantetheine-binding protein [Steroidobacteraceae bacterium]